MIARTGGMGAVLDTVTVEPDGRWTATGRSRTMWSGQFSEAELAQLRQLTGDPELSAEATAEPLPSCSESFIYTLSIDALRVRYPDCPDGARPRAASAIVGFVLGSIALD